MIDNLAGEQPIPTNIRQDIIERADGVPLFVQEMTKAVSILRGTSCLGSTTRPFAPPAATSTSGARWAQLLRSAGAQNVQVTAHVRFPKVGDYQRTHLLSLVEAMRDRILTSGRIGEAELIAHMASLSEHLENPATTLIDKMLVQSRSEIGDDR